MRRNIAKPLIMVLALGGLAACGDTAAEQAISGAGGGAGAAAVFDGTVATGAAVRAAANPNYCQKTPCPCIRTSPLPA